MKIDLGTTRETKMVRRKVGGMTKTDLGMAREIGYDEGRSECGYGLMELSPRLGLGIILGPLGQSLTHMNPRTRLWVQSLGTCCGPASIMCC